MKLHPDFLCGAVSSVDVEIVRPAPQRIELAYAITGSISEVRMHPFAAPARTDQLWRHTCFEAFVRAGGDAYYEFNFAPAGNWAAYRLGGYRRDLAAATVLEPPAIASEQQGATSWRLAAALDLAGLPELAENGALQMNLSAIIEDQDGVLSYWALAHPQGPADFHHPDCFQLELPPARPA